MTIGTMEGKLEQIMGMMNRYSLYLTRGSWDAEDLVQETWTRALADRQADSWRQHSNPEAWMLRVAKNIWTDQSRRRQVLNRLIGQLRHDAAVHTQTSLANEPGSSEMLELMFAALVKHLTPTQRVVFMLRDVYGYSAAETAERLGMSEGAVKAALHRARKGLLCVRKEIADNEISLPAEENWRTILRWIVQAYSSGNIEAVVGLLARDVHEPAAAIGITTVSSQRAEAKSTADSTMRMAA